MTTHLFQGHYDGDSIIVTSGITLCCQTHTLGLPKGDKGGINPAHVDCPKYLPKREPASVQPDRSPA